MLRLLISPLFVLVIPYWVLKYIQYKKHIVKQSELLFKKFGYDVASIYVAEHKSFTRFVGKCLK